VLDLRSDAHLDALRLTREALGAEDSARCQSVGEAAHYVGFEAIRAPSAARADGVILALFIDRLAPDSTLEVSSEDKAWGGPRVAVG
jgi:hypothetical protein